MSYQKPEVKEVKMNVAVSATSSNASSCNGGHCVRAPWSGDQN